MLNVSDITFRSERSYIRLLYPIEPRMRNQLDTIIRVAPALAALALIAPALLGGFANTVTQFSVSERAEAAFNLNLLTNSVHVQCLPDRWSRPRQLSVGGKPAYVQAPDVLSTEQGTVLLGAPSILWASSDHLMNGNATAAATGFRLGRNSEVVPIPLPPGHAILLAPRALANRASGMSAVWASEPSENQPLFASQQRALWFGTESNGKWSTPVRVFAADELTWSPSPNAVALGEHGAQVVVPFATRTPRLRGLLHARYANNSWITHVHAIEGLPAAANISLLTSDSILVSFTATQRSAEPNGSHVFAVRAAIGDSVWPKSALVYSSGRGGAVYLQQLSVQRQGSSQRQVALVWASVTPQSSLADSILVALSSNGGRSWTMQPTLKTPARVASISTASDALGRLHVVYRQVSPTKGILSGPMGYALLAGGVWTRHEVLPFGESMSFPRLARIGNDSILLSWGVGRTAIDYEGGEAPVGMISQIAVRCPK